MRVAIVAESFLPAVHGVTNSVLRTVEHLRTRGHEPVVVAPSPASTEGGLTAIERAVPAPVVWLPAVSLPGYRTFRVSPFGVGRVLGRHHGLGNVSGGHQESPVTHPGRH